MDAIRENARLWAVALILTIMATFAVTTLNPPTAEAGVTHAAVRYSAWLGECYYGGYSWYDYYYNGSYYWYWC